jgi:hypothetical protein
MMIDPLSTIATAFGPHATHLAYRPFLDPLNLHNHWFWTLIPLLMLTAMAYKGIRIVEFTPRRWLIQSAFMTAQLLILMAGLAIGLHLVVELFLPALG